MMSFRSSKKPKAMATTLFMFFLLFAVACGTTAQDTPVPPAATTAPAAEPAPTTSSMEPTAMVAAVKPTLVPTAAVEPAPAVQEWVSQGKYGSTVPFVHRGDPGFWDLHFGSSRRTTLAPSGPRYNQLVEQNPVKETEDIIGDLAESWEVSDDGQTYTFRLHNAQWSDGQPVTAKDIVFSLDRIVQPGATRGRSAPLRRFYEHQTAEVIDERTVRMPIKFPGATFLVNLGMGYMKMYPEHVAGELSQDDMNCCPEKMLGSGPWLFKDWQRGDSFEYEKNPNYFKEGRPFFDGFKVFVVKDKARVIASLQVGQTLGSLGPIGLLEPQEAELLERETGGRVKAYIKENVRMSQFYLRITEPPFDDPRVRRALFLAINRQELVKGPYRGFANVGTFFPPGFVEDPDELAQVAGYRFPKDDDLAEAKKLMAEAGYPDGFDAGLNVVNVLAFVPEAEAAADLLRRELGIDFKITVNPIAQWYVELGDGTFAASLGGTAMPVPDPENVIDQFYALDTLRNPHNWSDPRLTELMEAQSRELDPVQRKELFKEMVEILRQGESHLIPNTWGSLGGVLDHRIKNYHVPPAYQQAMKLEHIWFDPDAKLPGS